MLESFTWWPLLLILPATAWIVWCARRSVRLLSPRRTRLMTAVRLALVVLAAIALCEPSWQAKSDREAVIFVADHSESLGAEGRQKLADRVRAIAERLPPETSIGYVSVAGRAHVLTAPKPQAVFAPLDEAQAAGDGARSHLSAGVELAFGFFPAGVRRRIVLLTDGLQTAGDLERAVDHGALQGTVTDVVPVSGPARPDVRIAAVTTNQTRLHEGSKLELRADIEGSLSGSGTIRLFENGIEVERRPFTAEAGKPTRERFERTPREPNHYAYRVRIEGFAGDAIPANNEGLALVDVRGRPQVLYVEGEESEARFLVDSMAREGIQLHVRAPRHMPETPTELSAYDAVVLSDVAAHQLSSRAIAAVHDYVEKLGGGFVMIGGKNSFGAGGYYRTAIEDVLPVKMKAPDQEETFATALVLVIDRSGSMSGEKLEVCKAAAVGTVDLLGAQDYIGVVAFDSAASWIVPMTRASSKGAISGQIASIDSQGGTYIMPGMTAGHDGLNGVQAKVKHMIVLTDGQSEGTGYEALAARMLGEKITVSTVAVGGDADGALLERIAAAGGGKFYAAQDAATVPRIFTQDAMTHLGKLIREESFSPKLSEIHPMLKGWPVDESPKLLGYVKTTPKSTAQVPLVTDLNDPLLAHWRFGLGKVTAFTSDCKSRWSALWVEKWPGYSQFWAQVLRETARESQGRRIDVELGHDGDDIRVTVHVLEDAAHFRNDAEVAADVYHVNAASLSSRLELRRHDVCRQTAPGRYETTFRPDEPGVYLVRARTGADLVSAGIVHQPSTETALGQIDTALLNRVAQRGGGQVLAPDQVDLPKLETAAVGQVIDLVPWIVGLMLLLFLIDTVIRRWENVHTVFEWLGFK